MTCNDCIHYDVCPKPYYGEKLCCNDVEERCENFKNKGTDKDSYCPSGERSDT